MWPSCAEYILYVRKRVTGGENLLPQQTESTMSTVAIPTFMKIDAIKPLLMFGTMPTLVEGSAEMRTLLSELVIGVDMPANMISSTWLVYVWNRVTGQYKVCCWEKSKYYTELMSRVPTVLLYEDKDQYGGLIGFRRQRWQESKAGQAWMQRQCAESFREIWKEPRMLDGDKEGIWTNTEWTKAQIMELIG